MPYMGCHKCGGCGDHLPCCSESTPKPEKHMSLKEAVAIAIMWHIAKLFSGDTAAPADTRQCD